MLPDYPSLTKDLDEFLNRFLRRRARFYEGVVGEISQHTIHEGSENSIVRPDGEEDQTEMIKVEEYLEISRKDISRFNLGDVLIKLDEMAKSMAEEKEKYFFEQLNKAVNKTGNVVDGKGKPLSAEVVLEVLERIQMEFNEEGEMEDLNVVVSPTQASAVRETLERLKTEPKIQKKYQKIMEKKKEEWRAREAARTLVG